MSWRTSVGSASRTGLSQGRGAGRRKAAARDVGRIRPRGELGAGQAFEQGGARQAVGAVQTGAGGLADGVQVADVGAPIQVGVHAAAGIMRGGHHRNRLARDVDAVVEAAPHGCPGSAPG